MSDLITEFDAETFALVQRPADCAPHGGCASYDWAHNSKHFHCEVPMDGKGPESVLRCNKLVFVEQDGPDAGDYYVEPKHGIRCAECKDVACVEHVEKNTPSGRTLCSFCSSEEQKRAHDEMRMDLALIDAKRGLKAYLECLRTETNAVKIKETIHDLHEIEDLAAEIMHELKPNIERAYGFQQPLPVPA